METNVFTSKRLLLFCFIFQLFSQDLIADEFTTYYLSPKSSTGTKANSYTIETLFQLMGSIRKTMAQGKSVRLIIRDGEYPLKETFYIDGSDLSGQLIIEAEHIGKAILSNRVPITNFVKANDNKIRQIVDKNVYNHLYVADLTSTGLKGKIHPINSQSRSWLFLNGKQQKLACWPTIGYDSIYQAIGTTAGEYGTRKEGIFTSADSHLKKYKSFLNLYAYGFWCWGWSDEYQKVLSINRSSNTINLSQPYHYYGYKNGAKYRIYNSIQDIKAPGDYCIDDTEGKIYWYAPLTYDKNKDCTWLSGNCYPYMFRLKNVHHAKIKGITLTGGGYNGIHIDNCEDTHIEDCRIYQIGALALYIEQGRNNTVERCLFEDIGESAINASSGDRKTLTDANILIKDNIIRRYARYIQAQRSGIGLYGCGLTAEHNEIYDSPCQAFWLEGNNIAVKYNKIHNVTQLVTDAGMLDIYNNPSFRGNIVCYNYWKGFHSGKDKIAAVRLDDMISGMDIYGNIFDDCGTPSFGAIEIHAGCENKVHDNLFYNCTAMVSFTHWNKDFWYTQLHNPTMQKKLYQDVNIMSKNYLKAYPTLKKIDEGDTGNEVYNNTYTLCPQLFLRSGQIDRCWNNKQSTTNKMDLFTIFKYDNMGFTKNYYKSY